jgi:hypothetical protein
MRDDCNSFFSDTMSDFAKIIPQKELVYLLKLTIHKPSLHSAAGLCMVGLVDLRALHGANIRAKRGYFVIIQANYGTKA